MPLFSVAFLIKAKNSHMHLLWFSFSSSEVVYTKRKQEFQPIIYPADKLLVAFHTFYTNKRCATKIDYVISSW